jgi:hypothetical protein
MSRLAIEAGLEFRVVVIKRHPHDFIKSVLRRHFTDSGVEQSMLMEVALTK